LRGTEHDQIDDRGDHADHRARLTDERSSLMPAGVFGIPAPGAQTGWGSDGTLVNVVPTPNGAEVPMGRGFVIPGPHEASTAAAAMSVSNPSQTKNNHTRLYRNGVLVADDSWSSAGDSVAGYERVTVVNLPAFPRAAVYRWTLQTTAVATPTLASAHRAIRIPWSVDNLGGKVTPPRGGTFGLPSPRTIFKWTLPLTSAAGHYAFLIPAATGYTLLPQTTSQHVSGLRRPVPESGSFSVIGKLSMTGSGSDNRSGIFFAIPGGKANVCGPFQQDGAFGAIGVATASYTADWSSWDGYLATTAGTIGTMALFKISWDGAGTLTFRSSTDGGATWTTIGSRGSMARPDSCGICQYSNGGGGLVNYTAALNIGGFWVTSP
jgi:hypothetical protein